MSTALTINSVTYNYPQLGDENWGQDATNWAVGITQLVNSIQTIVNNSITAGVFQLGNGAAGTPSLSFQNSLTTGIYRVNSNILGFTAAGVAAGQISSGGLLQWKNGSAAAPAFSFTASPTSGMYSPGANQVALSTNGLRALSIDALQNVDIAGDLTIHGTLYGVSFDFVDLNATGNIILGANNLDTLIINADLTSNITPDVSTTYDLGVTGKRWRDLFVSRNAYLNTGLFGNGTAALPSITFESDNTTGIFKSATTTLGFTTAATLAGTINSNQKWAIGNAAGVETHDIFGAGVRLANASNSGPIVGSLQSAAIADNQVAPVAVLTLPASANEAVVLHYSIVRGTNRETGTMHLVNNGTTADVEVESRPVGDPGVEFSADINTTNVRLLYTSTSTGVAGTIKFFTIRWTN